MSKEEEELKRLIRSVQSRMKGGANAGEDLRLTSDAEMDIVISAESSAVISESMVP